MAKKKVGKKVAPIVPHRGGVESRSIWNIAAAVSQDQLPHHAQDEALPFVISPASGWPYSTAGSSTDAEGYIRIYHHRDYLFRKLNTTPIVGNVNFKPPKKNKNKRKVLTLLRIKGPPSFIFPASAIDNLLIELAELNQLHDYNERQGIASSLSISLSNDWPYSRESAQSEFDEYIRVYHHRDYLFKKLNTTPITRSVENKKFKNKGSGRDILTLRKVGNVAQFSWPTTTILTSNHSLTEINWPKIGILQAVGYRVGDKGLFKNERQKILNEVYKNQLPLVESQSYMDEWGSPKSSQRLYKIAYTIAALVRNAKRKTRADMRCAISEWESDLSWLRDKYYVDMMWDWPST
ncbi:MULTISPECIES: hypothetical protein [Aeromonas]|uniref:hypothetical protein n=1 Tax=Aeromonas TaxID=642 RepID=UPI001C22FEF9|nr:MULTISPECIES: hypothetical protein [Aeromonas]QXC29689.1 hypothetical protein I6L39_17635 [Aeromonas sp. FDAARGOS 1409]WKL90564.1 hypothetical protein Q2F48_09265 [Aeromonas caviae]